jgi:dTDP-4-amino-4,6-dideoxygalactose transaminase
LDTGNAIFLTSARVGIAHVLRAHRIGRGHEVLLPAYHCPAMVEPVTQCGATPIYYRIRGDTHVDLDDVGAKCGPRTRALVAVHYFGFPQDFGVLRKFCDERRLLLIEDCAHTFFGSVNGESIGSQGDYAIASVMKFFPIFDGGVLVSRRYSLNAIHLRGAGLRFELKGIVNVLEQSADNSRLRPLDLPLRLLFSVKDLSWRACKKRMGGAGNAPVANPADGGYDFDPTWLDKRMSAVSRLIIGLVSVGRIIERRRANYQKWLDGMQGVAGAIALFPELPPGVVPYMFPLRLADPDPTFMRLRREGLPVLRFAEHRVPGIDATVCPVTVDFARSVVQLPCHQELREHEMDRLMERVRNAVGGH